MNEYLYRDVLAGLGVTPSQFPWLLERLGDFWSVPFCLLASPIFAGSLSSLLSVLGSPAT
jgi:hypothetical protein